LNIGNARDPAQGACHVRASYTSRSCWSWYYGKRDGTIRDGAI